MGEHEECRGGCGAGRLRGGGGGQGKARDRPWEGQEDEDEGAMGRPDGQGKARKHGKWP